MICFVSLTPKAIDLSFYDTSMPMGRIDIKELFLCFQKLVSGELHTLYFGIGIFIYIIKTYTKDLLQT